MDDNLSQNPQGKRSPAPNGTGKNLLKVIPFLQAGIFEVLFVGVVLVLLFGILNYFNILSLSTLYPKQLGFLPQNQVSPTISSLNRLSCPSLKEFCEKGQGIFKDGQYVGLGYSLSSENAIFAAFDGNLSIALSPTSAGALTTKKKLITAYLDNPDLKLRAIYLFKGSITKTGKVNKGEQIAISNGKPIKVYDNNSFIFSLIPGYPGSNTPTILNKENFE